VDTLPLVLARVIMSAASDGPEWGSRLLGAGLHTLFFVSGLSPPVPGLAGSASPTPSRLESFGWRGTL